METIIVTILAMAFASALSYGAYILMLNDTPKTNS